MAKNDKSVKRGVYLYIDGKQIKNDVNSIKAEIKKLTGELKDMTIGSREYVEQMAKIRNLNSMLKEHQKSLRGVNKEVKATTFSFGKFVDGFNRFGGFIASVVASLTGLVLGLKALRDEKNKLEDSQASLKSLTGLDETSVDWLTKQAQKLSTTMTKEGLRVRQSTAEILDAYMLVGSAKAELLGSPEALAAVTEEAMRLQSAAGDITLAEAVDAVTLSLNQFGAPAEDAARYVNVLAAGSKEGASGVASITSSIKRAGVAAAGANVSIEETVALVETLAYKGITDEVAGTALKKFFLVLQTGADDTNPKVVGLTKALENLKAKNMGAADIKKMFGEEGYNAAAVILQNTEMVNQLTEAVTGTNIAFEQSAINSDTASAKLAQVRNQMKLAGIELIEKLNPAILVSTNAMTYVIKILPGVIDWFKKWGAEVTILSAYFLLLATRVTITNKAIAAYHSVLAAGTAIKKGYALAIMAINAARDTSLRGLVNMRNAIRTSNALTRTATATVTLLKSALFLMTGQLKAARIAFQAFTIAARANPFGIVLTVVAALTLGLVNLRKKQDEASAAQVALNRVSQKTSEEYDKQAAHIKQLNDVLHNNKVGIGERRKALDELKSIIPGYNAMLTKEGELIEENTSAIDNYLVALDKEIRLKKFKEEREAAILRKDALEKQLKSHQQVLDNNPLVTTQTFNTSFGAMNFDPLSRHREKVQSLNAELTKTNAELDALTKEYEALSQVKTVDDDNDGKCPKCGNKPCTCDIQVDEEDDVKKQLQALELEHGKRIAEIKKQYLEDDKMTQSEYNKRIQDAEVQLLNEKLKVMGLDEAQRQRFNERLLDIQLKQRDELRDQRLDETKDTLAANQKKFQLEAEQLAKDYQNRLITREDFLKKLFELQELYKVAGDTPEVLTPEQQEMIDKYLEKIDEVIAKYKEAAHKTEEWRDITQKAWGDVKSWADMTFDEMTVLLDKLVQDLFKLGDGFESTQDKLAVMATFGASYMQQLGAAVGQTLGGAKDSLEDFLKASLQMVLEVIKQQLIAEQAAAIASVTMKDITTKGFAGIATAAAKIALITAAFEAAKTAIGNFYTGGYTPSGEWDEPKGIVHSNEFVANRYAVANPAVRPVLDLIDSAQRSGTIANLTGGDIAAVAGGSAHPVAAASSVMQLQAQSDDRELKQTVRGLSQVLSRLVERLDEPIEAYGVISGRHGLKRKLDEYDRLLNNKSRKP